MIAAHLLGEGGGAGRPEEGSLALGWLGARRLGIELQDRQRAARSPATSGRRRSPGTRSTSNARGQCAGACADAIARLRAVLEPELDEKGMRQLFDEIEMPLVSVLARMELNGVAIDTGALHEMSESLTMEIRADRGGHLRLGGPRVQHRIADPALADPVRGAAPAEDAPPEDGGYSTDAQSLEGLRGLHEISRAHLRSTAS